MLTSASAQDTKPAAPAAVTKNVDVAKFEQLLSGTNVVILDVRTSAEYAEGHLTNSVLLDYRSPDFAAQVAKLDKSKQYLVHCAGGGRSARACTKMESLGFTNLVNLEGGYGAWKEAGKPVTK
ncbi:MAG: rhodanese-like domain-containing protein [Verrucomicrobia bacterium]|nr:rhodanese-like domain-containing protein [Verrucomicrobiota bacterium]